MAEAGQNLAKLPQCLGCVEELTSSAVAGAASVVITAGLRLIAAHKQWNVPKI